MAEEAGEWASRLGELADGEGLASRCQELRERISELRSRQGGARVVGIANFEVGVGIEVGVRVGAVGGLGSVLVAGCAPGLLSRSSCLRAFRGCRGYFW